MPAGAWSTCGGRLPDSDLREDSGRRAPGFGTHFLTRGQYVLRSRRTARRESARAFLAHRAALRPDQRPPKLWPAPALEAARDPGGPPAARAASAGPLLRHGRPGAGAGAARRRVTGLDFSERMLESGGEPESVQQRPISEQRRGAALRRSHAAARSTHRRVSAARQGSSNFVCGDAQRIPFADNTFDIVTVGYGLRNLASWEAGLREMQRVAKPGGRLVVLDFGKPDNTLWRSSVFRLPEVVCALPGADLLRQRQRVCLHPRVSQALPGAARCGG